MPTRKAPPLTPAQELISSLTGYTPPTETAEQSAARELLEELYGVSLPSPAERGEDYWTAHEVRRRPPDLPYNPIPPQPGAFGDFPADMEWLQADSSNVDKAAYDAASKRLFIQFLSGALYVYYEVPLGTWEDYLASNSKGMFVYYVLRNGSPTGARFRYENLRSGQRTITRGPDRGKGKVTPITPAAPGMVGRR